MSQIPLDIKLTLKKCPICETWMEGESSQEVKRLLRKRVINENKIICPTCGYRERMIQEYSAKAVGLILEMNEGGETNANPQ